MSPNTSVAEHLCRRTPLSPDTSCRRPPPSRPPDRAPAVRQIPSSKPTDGNDWHLGGRTRDLGTRPSAIAGPQVTVSGDDHTKTESRGSRIQFDGDRAFYPLQGRQVIFQLHDPFFADEQALFDAFEFGFVGRSTVAIVR